MRKAIGKSGVRCLAHEALTKRSLLAADFVGPISTSKSDDGAISMVSIQTVETFTSTADGDKRIDGGTERTPFEGDIAALADKLKEQPRFDDLVAFREFENLLRDIAGFEFGDPKNPLPKFPDASAERSPFDDAFDRAWGELEPDYDLFDGAWEGLVPGESGSKYADSLRPSGDVSDLTSGIAGIDVRHEYVASTGTSITTTSYYHPDGSFAGVHQISEHRDGSRTVLDTYVTADGSTATYRHYDSEGNLTDESFIVLSDDSQDPHGEYVDPRYVALFRRFDNTAKAPIASGVRVNPVEDAGDTDAPLLIVDWGIEVNPSPAASDSQGYDLDPGKANQSLQKSNPDPGARPEIP